MEQIKRRYIDWAKTAKNLKLLRNDNINLRRYVCMTLDNGDRGCNRKCEVCKYEMDNTISQAELAKAFKVSVGMVVNWENGKSKPAIEDLLFYSEVCKVSLSEILVFAN